MELVHGLPAADRPTVVALTNTAESTLARAADYVVEMHAGTEHAVSTKTYVNTLAAFALMLAPTDSAPVVGEIEQAAFALDAWSASLDAAVDHATGLLAQTRSLVLVGRGPSLAAANAGALTIKEAAKTHAEALGAGAFRHGPVELAGPELTVAVLAGDPEAAVLNQALAQDVASYGSPVLWVGELVPPGVSPLPSPTFYGAFGRSVAEIASLQLCSLALARLRAIEPGVFRVATKVTTIQ